MGKAQILSVKAQVLFVKSMITLVVLLSGLFSAAPVEAGEAGRPKVIMVVVNRITVNDITDNRYQNIKRLLSRSSLGLMTINTGGDYSDVNSYVSLGGGDKFIGSALAGESYNRDEILADGSKAYEAYSRNTGKSPGNSRVLNTTIAATLRVNQKRYTVSTPGWLGSVLHDAGLKTAVIGNSDIRFTDQPNRLAVTIAMDDLGRVDEGNVSKDLLKNDTDFPYGWRTDYGKLQTELDRVWPASDFIVVETGDTVRANNSIDEQMIKMVEYHRYRALKEVDGFIGSLLEKKYQNTMIMIVTPLPDTQALRDGVRLTPLIINGGSAAAGGVLTSPSTRQQGLVANYDVTAAVADYLGVKKAEGVEGLPILGLSEISTAQSTYVRDMSAWLTANSLQRVGVLFYFIRFQWIVYFLVFLQVIFRYYRMIGLARGLLAGILIYPLAILLAPLTGSVNPWLTISLSLVLLALITYLLTRIRDDLKLYLAVSIVTVVPSVVDVLTGGNLMKKAALSYDVVMGGRFYGIGNEYMGVVIGAAILGLAALIQLLPGSRRKVIPFVGLIFVGLVVFFAAPGVGTKAGGALTAMVGFALTTYKFTGRKITWRSVLLLFSALAAGVGVLALVNFVFPAGEQSHIGRAFNNLFEGNLIIIWQITIRKLLANYYLLQHSPFSTVLLLQLFVWCGLLFRNRSQLDTLGKQMPFLKAGFVGMFFGALAAIAFNDSGVIGAALLLNYLIAPLVLQVLRTVSANRG